MNMKILRFSWPVLMAAGLFTACEQQEVPEHINMTTEINTDDPAIADSLANTTKQGAMPTSEPGFVCTSENDTCLMAAYVWLFDSEDEASQFCEALMNGDSQQRGDTEPQGAQGAQGAKGEKGEKGDTGATGAKGDAGGKGTLAASKYRYVKNTLSKRRRIPQQTPYIDLHLEGNKLIANLTATLAGVQTDDARLTAEAWLNNGAESPNSFVFGHYADSCYVTADKLCTIQLVYDATHSYVTTFLVTLSQNVQFSEPCGMTPEEALAELRLFDALWSKPAFRLSPSQNTPNS